MSASARGTVNATLTGPGGTAASPRGTVNATLTGPLGTGLWMKINGVKVEVPQIKVKPATGASAPMSPQLTVAE